MSAATAVSDHQPRGICSFAGASVDLSGGVVIGGRYRLDRQVGQGGMGSVWAASHVVTRRPVALKFLRGPARESAALRRRLFREARAASAVGHPNVIEIFDVFELEDQTPVMVMDLLQGETLGARIAREGALTLEQAATLLLPVVSAVGATHARGLVHRDLKPDNVFLSEAFDGSAAVKVLDFGIAKFSIPAGEIAQSVVTQTGATVGTPCYMAPEQAAAETDLDHRVDVWALGVVLYECLSGVRPIDGESVGQVVTRLLTTGITPLERLVLDLPEDVTQLVGRMLSRERSRRPESVQEVYEVLARHTTATAPAFGLPNSEVAVEVDDVPIPTLPSVVGTEAEPLAPRVEEKREPRRARIGWQSALAIAAAMAAIGLVARSAWSARPAPEAIAGPLAAASEEPAPPIEEPVAAAAPSAREPAPRAAAEASTSTSTRAASTTTSTSTTTRLAPAALRPPEATTPAQTDSAPRPPVTFQGGLAEQPPF